MYGDLAYRALMLYSKVVELHYPVTELEPFDFELLQAAHTAIRNREAFHAWDANKEGKK